MSDNAFRAILTTFVVFVLALGSWFGWQTYTAHKASLSVQQATLFPDTEPSTPSPAKVNTPKSSAVAGATSLPVSIGSVAVLNNGSDDVDVATTQNALINLVYAASHGDHKRYDTVFKRGFAFRVPDGTHVTLDGQGKYSGRVTILDGKAAGRTGYVPQEWVNSP